MLPRALRVIFLDMCALVLASGRVRAPRSPKINTPNTLCPNPKQSKRNNNRAYKMPEVKKEKLRQIFQICKKKESETVGAAFTACHRTLDYRWRPGRRCTVKSQKRKENTNKIPKEPTNFSCILCTHLNNL